METQERTHERVLRGCQRGDVTPHCDASRKPHCEITGEQQQQRITSWQYFF